MTAKSGHGGIRGDFFTVVANIPPVADAGSAQQVTAGSLVALNGIGMDTDGSIVAYQWSQTNTPSVLLNNPTTPNASFTAPDVTQTTTLTFQLTVTDNDAVTVYPFTVLSGTITASNAMLTDSDVNDPSTTREPNDAATQYQHIPKRTPCRRRAGRWRRTGYHPCVSPQHVTRSRGECVRELFRV